MRIGRITAAIAKRVSGTQVALRARVPFAVRSLLTLVLVLLVGCSEQRTTEPAAGGIHPVGWGDRTSSAFHATWISQNGFPLPRCQQCHGDDYLGGEVGVSCVQSGCHTQSPIACTTCHGSNGTPRPAQGAHWAHEAYCSTCHNVPTETTASVQAHASADASTSLIDFSGIAVLPKDWLDAGSSEAGPAWDPVALHCTNTYCHGAVSPQWTTPSQIPCNGCHEAPPADHARWSRVANSTSSCTTCHPAPSAPTHVNGVVNITVTSCTTCHGSNGHANPPVSLDGSVDPTTRGVGAHEAHLDPAFANRIANPLLCNDCHQVPTEVMDPSHWAAPEAQVRFPFGGTYDATNATCNVWCHFSNAAGTVSMPAPTWTDDTGDNIQCNSCHAFPPVVTRQGDPHPSVPGELSECLRCHVFGPTTHVNGVVDFVQP
jgi:predicted CxxxxCH...CXXCH cytochrome family protein